MSLTALRAAHYPQKRGNTHGAIAVALKRMTKLVFSRSIQDVTRENSRLLCELDPHAIGTMKAQPGKDLIIFGSGSIVSELGRHGLIDEYQFAVCPVLLGGGQSLVRGMSKRLPLDYPEARRLPSGDVILRCAWSMRVSP